MREAQRKISRIVSSVGSHNHRLTQVTKILIARPLLVAGMAGIECGNPDGSFDHRRTCVRLWALDDLIRYPVSHAFIGDALFLRRGRRITLMHLSK